MAPKNSNKQKEKKRAPSRSKIPAQKTERIPVNPSNSLFRPSNAKSTKTAKPRSKPSQIAPIETDNECTRHNIEAHWATYKDLRSAIDRAWNKLREDIRRKAPTATLLEDRAALTLLLGECNYMARECMSYLQTKK